MTYNQKSNDQFIIEMKEKHPSIIILSDYTTAITKVHCSCVLDNYEWFATPNDLLRGKGCPKCAGNVGLNSQEMNHILTTKGFSVVSRHEGYIAMSKKSEFYCLVCGNEWLDTFVCVRKRGCPKCRGLLPRIKTHNEYISELKDRKILIYPLENFVSKNKKMLHLCTEHGVVWSITPSDVLGGHGCRKCKIIKIGNKKRRDVDYYKMKLAEASPDVELVGEYKRGDMHTLHRCKICGFEWSPMPTNLLAGGGCPKCKSSRGEKKICSVLDEMNVKYIQQYRISDCRFRRPLPFDFYLPEFNLLIEYQGRQHYIPYSFGSKTLNDGAASLSETQKRDAIKRNYCLHHYIKLIEIPYWEYKNIESILKEHIIEPLSLII